MLKDLQKSALKAISRGEEVFAFFCFPTGFGKTP
jgi:superfamily II DNA or RNA helicase